MGDRPITVCLLYHSQYQAEANQQFTEHLQVSLLVLIFGK